MNHKQFVLTHQPDAYYNPSNLAGHRIVRPGKHNGYPIDITMGKGRNERAAWRSASRAIAREQQEVKHVSLG